MPVAAFLQTEGWARVEARRGRRAMFISGDGWRALLTEHVLPFGQSYLYCPRGPIPASDAEKSRTVDGEVFLHEAERCARESGAAFLRWDPVASAGTDLPAHGHSAEPIPAVQPRENAVVDLARPWEEVLGAMHEKTRYNVRLAERREVSVFVDTASDGPERFVALLRETATRDGFTAHARNQYDAILEELTEKNAHREDPVARLYFAQREGDILAAALVIFHGDTATYLHGASASRRREVMAPYALHAQVMRDAMQEGARQYDLGGISDVNPRWAGITRFKRGFGARTVAFAESRDVIFRPQVYAAYRLARNLSDMLR